MTEPFNSSGISCTTFNILAPIYKRLDQQNQILRESECRAFWISRNHGILDWLLYERSSIICLQEFWVGNEELVHMYQKRLGDAGYITFQLARTNNRGDGLLTAVHKDYFRVLNYRELLFNDFGDRVAQLLHVQLAVPLAQNRKGNAQLQQEILIVNTHLLFPHDSSLSIARLHQVYKILQYVEAYHRENKLKPIPIILCGDWNGSKRGHVYKFLRSQGFVSSYDTAHHYTDSDADAHKWVSHRNHRGNICGVDFIWLLNPNKFRKPLKTSWAEAVFGIVKRFGSQERENSMKRISCLAPVSFTREESQIPLARPSTSLAGKWGSASAPDHRCQIGEDVEHRIGMIETSLTKFGMILDSIQGDVMQVNKGMKEFLMEMEGLRKKLVVHDSSQLLMNKGHEDIKASLDAALKSISDQTSIDLYQEKLQQNFAMISAVPEKIEACLLNLQSELCKTITKEMEARMTL